MTMADTRGQTPVSPAAAAGHDYVLITPARNEVAFIERALQSVVAQTKRPLRYVIVSDGSTDGTDELVSRYSEQHPWIELVRMPERVERHFAGKVFAFRAGLARVEHLNYEFMGALDADISFDPDYFAFLVDRLIENPKLGLVGTPFEEDGVTYDYRFASVEHVSGACQFFRRECYEAIGGYRPMESGGIDLVAVLTSRMKGWQVRTFLEKRSKHHRKQGSAMKNGWAVIVNDGRKDYLLGAHPGWEFLRGIHRLVKPPYVVGGLCLLYGFFRPWLLRTTRTAPADVVAFRQREQRNRLYALPRRLLGLGGASLKQSR